MPYLGHRRTKHKIYAHRTMSDRVEIPANAILDDVRTSARDVAGYPIPDGIAEVVRAGNPNIHIFEHCSETLFMSFSEGLLLATESTEIQSSPLPPFPESVTTAEDGQDRPKS